MSDWSDVANKLDEYLSEKPQSTYRDMQAWLQHWKPHAASTRPIDALLQVIRVDTANLINFLELTIGDINLSLSEASRERALRSSVDSWRSLLFWAQTELPKLSESIIELIAYFKEEDRSTQQLNEEHKDLITHGDEDIQRLLQEIADVVIHIEKAQRDMNSELALINTQKSISEAENVKRLTELAFIFVPMTFAAAIYSIQVQEFQDKPPRLWTFFVTAVCLVMLVYCVRILQYFVVRNQWGGLLQAMWHNVWYYVQVLGAILASVSWSYGYKVVSIFLFVKIWLRKHM